MYIMLELKSMYSILMQLILYLNQSVSAGAHECVHHTIKSVVVGISSNVAYTFA